MSGRPIRYVALGDSYTIGTSVATAERFPDQLVAALAGASPPLHLDLVANLGVDGFTTADLLRDEVPTLASLEPGFATVLIGVNDVVQRVPLARYRDRAAMILDAVLDHVHAPDRVVVVSVPDYTVTPAGADYGEPVERSAGIDAVNRAMTDLATARGIAFVDITDISRDAARDRSLVAIDGLHPSGRQYARWVERITPVVTALLAG